MEGDPVESGISVSGRKARPEGKGIRAPYPGSLREWLMNRLIETEGGLVPRSEVLGKYNEKAVDWVIHRLNVAGLVESVRVGRGVSYRLTQQAIQQPAPMVLKRAEVRRPKPAIRQWPKAGDYEAPRAIPISVFDLARTL